MSLRVHQVGHIVLRVRDLDASLRFSCGILGLSEFTRHDFGEGPMAFLSTGDTHRDLALALPARRRDDPTLVAYSDPLTL